MRVLLAAHGVSSPTRLAGRWPSIAHRVQVERCDPERLDDFTPQDGFSLC